tara:strand:+ start:293 stop:733 length:441 start_codon:yes stop_codon:yes gene_type:complete
MNEDIGNILNKYINNKSDNNDSFVNLIGGYNKSETDKDIKDLDNELKKQIKTNNTFNNNEEILDNCKTFMSDYSKIINNQYNEINNLMIELPKLIKENKSKIGVNEELKTLLDSNDYINLSAKLREMKTNIQKLKLFLVEEGIQNF